MVVKLTEIMVAKLTVDEVWIGSSRWRGRLSDDPSEERDDVYTKRGFIENKRRRKGVRE